MTTTGTGRDVLDVSNVEEFISSPEGLRTVLRVIDRIGPDGWRMLPAAQTLMEFAERRFTPVARAWRRPPADAAYAAWLAMRGRSVRTAADPWGAVTRAVELSMQAETYAERLLISPEKARRPIHRPSAAPVRAGEHEEFLYDVIAADRDANDVGDGIDELVAVAAAFLVVAGWRHSQARWAMEYISTRTADLGSHESALDVLRRDDAVRVRLGLPQRSWNRLLVLIIGPKPRTATETRFGLLARVLLGDSLADLVEDRALLDQARGTIAGAVDG